jgi:hypothetical protein
MSRLALPITAIALSLAAGNATAAFQDPSTATWGGWTRGTSGTLYAGWNVFADETPAGGIIVDSTPDVPANTLIGGATTPGGPTFTSFGDSSFTVTELSGASFVTGGGNIYSVAAANSFTLAFQNRGELPFRVALQTRTLGTALDPASILLNGVAPDARQELGRVTLGGFGGTQLDNLFVWNVASGRDLTLAFAAAASHMSLDALTLDAAPVPVPAAVWLLGSALLGLGSRARRRQA